MDTGTYTPDDSVCEAELGAGHHLAIIENEEINTIAKDMIAMHAGARYVILEHLYIMYENIKPIFR